jgi:tRNA U34 5-methylaminomethyl-2-thiouridine-forming methyltransferase MnmC
MSLELIPTEDGSFTFYRADIDETYHSRHGAKQESQYVFLDKGLKYYCSLHQPEVIRIFEVGFGTGLNALLTLEQAQCSVDYKGVEKFPIDTETHKKWLKQMDLNHSIGAAIIDLDWDKKCAFENHIIHKSSNDLFDFETQDNAFDLIYFDAFGFRAQEEMWTSAVCKYMHQILDTKGILVTYAAKGLVRRNLESAGFICERLEGPPGKREMLRATKI